MRTLHHPRYPDIPIWLRSTGVDRTKAANMANLGRRPTHASIDWGLYEADIVEMLERGLEPPEIARELDLPQPMVTAKCARMIREGEVVPGWE